MKYQTGLNEFKGKKFLKDGKLRIPQIDLEQVDKSLRTRVLKDVKKLEKAREFKIVKKWYDTLTLAEKENEVITWVANKLSEWEKKGYKFFIGFSGGKDSLVVMDLVQRVKNIPAIFCNTGLEYPETIKYVEKLVENGKNLYIKKPIQNFWYFIKHIKPPSSKGRWCCKTTKFFPMVSFINDMGWNLKKTVGFMGTRGEENVKRTYYGRLDINPFLSNWNFYPIYYWNEKDVWDYITKYSLEYCALYDRKFSRLGCMICPMNADAKGENMVKKCYRKFYDKYFKLLNSYREKYNLPKKWITGNYWRFWFITKGVDLENTIIGKRSGDLNSGLVYRINDVNKLPIIQQLLLPFVITAKWRRLIKIEYVYYKHDKYFDIYVNYFAYGNKELFKRFEEQLVKALNCIYCGFCISLCSVNAIRIEKNKYEIIKEKCIGCLQCCKLSKCIKWNYSNIKNRLEV